MQQSITEKKSSVNRKIKLVDEREKTELLINYMKQGDDFINNVDNIPRGGI